MIDYGCGVRLGPIMEELLPQLADWRNDYRIRRWTRQNDLISWIHHENWFERISTSEKDKMYTVLTENGAELLGVCGLTHMDLVNRNAEFSLYIAPSFHRQGHGKKALKTLLSHGFNTYGLEVIWGESFAHNPAAKMFIDVGFREEGIRRNFYFRDGRFIHAHLFSILREEWAISEQFHGFRDQKCST